MSNPPTTFRALLTPRARTALRPRAWQAAPPVEDRAAWSGLDRADTAEVLRAARSWAERAAEAPPRLTLWHHYAATGERQPYEHAQRGLLGSAGAAALALMVTDDEAALEDLADAIWHLCELTAWCLPSHYALPETGERPPLPIPGRDILDLSDGYVGGMLAAIDSVAGTRLETRFPGLRARVHDEIRRRVLDPWRRETYFWHGHEETPNNWAPWIVSNVLVCAAVVEPDAAVLAADVEQALQILDRFRAGYAPDGSCDEGATYWWWAGATLFEALEVLHGISGGELDGFAVAPVPAMARFPLAMQIDARTQVNFSDGAASLPPNASWHLLGRFGATIGDETVVRHARWMGRQHPFHVPEQLAPQFLRTLRELRDPHWAEQGPAEPGMPASWYAPGTELAASRERTGAVAGWFVAAKGGHNDVSHNHNDVGGVIASLDGDPVLIDVGVGVYRRETFEPATRYGIWTMRSAFHSVPLPAGPGSPSPATAGGAGNPGVEQSPGEEFAARGTAFVDEGTTASLRMDLAPAYPPEAGLASCWREVTLLRPRSGDPDEDPDGSGVTIRDSWCFAEPRRMTLVLMTRDAPSLPAPGRIRIGAALATFDPARFEARIERIPTGDEKLEDTWGPHVHRILLAQRSAAAEGTCAIRLARAPQDGARS